MEFKRRRMIKSEIDRLLSDEGTRNLLSGIKVLHKSKKLTRIVTRNRVPITNKTKTPTNSRGIIANKSTSSGHSNSSSANNSSSSRVNVKVSNNSNEKSKKIIKKSLSLLGHSNTNKINGKLSNGPNGTRISNGGGGGKMSNSGGAGAKLSNGVRGSGSPGVGRVVTPTMGNTNAKNSPSPTGGGGGGNNGNTSNGIGVTSGGPKVSNSGSGQSSSPALPLLATLVRGNQLKHKQTGILKRGHVAFITLSYQNHLCVLRTQDLRDLVRKLEEYESRKTISVIVVNSSSDRFFCDGLDYKELIHPDLNKRKQAVQHRVACIKNVLNTLAKSKKLLIASVNGGKVNGFGIMILGLFDMIYANDKATFSLQKYFQLKQPPEGISVFSQTQLQSPMMKSLVFMGKVYTASEMNQNGFLTEVLWDGGRYHEQLAIKLQNVNAHEHTKSIYKTYSAKNTKQLGSDLAHEFSILESIWMTDAWQKGAVQQLNRDRHN